MILILFGVAIADNDVSDYAAPVYWHNGTSLAEHLSSTTTLPASQWNHIAVVRDGSNFALFLNSTRIATYSNSSAVGSGNRIAFVGHTGNSSEGYIGIFSNVRLVKGSSVYDPTQTSLTVPTSPLTAITNTVFLVGQSNRFIDNSSSAHSLSIESVQKYLPTPFTQSKTANVGAGFTDGTDDHVVETLDTSSDFNLGTDQFTIEAWVYTQSTDQQTIVIPYGSTAFNIYLHYDAVHVYFNTGVKIDGDSGSVESYVQKHALNHVVVQRR